MHSVIIKIISVLCFVLFQYQSVFLFYVCSQQGDIRLVLCLMIYVSLLVQCNNNDHQCVVLCFISVIVNICISCLFTAR